MEGEAEFGIKAKQEILPMKELKRNLIFWLRALSYCLTIGSLIWWVSADTNEPRWLFYPSLIVTAILSLVDKQARYRQERTVAEYENLGRNHRLL